MGRKPKPEKQQYTEPAATKLDPQLFENVKSICQERRWTVSTFMREAATEFVKSLKGKAAA